MFFEPIRLEKFFAYVGSFDEKITIFRGTMVEMFDLGYNLGRQHETICSFGYLATLDHLLEDTIKGWFEFMLVIYEHLF